MTATTSDGKISARLIFVALGAALGGFVFGYDSSIVNGTVDAVEHEFSLNAVAVGFTVSCALLGAALGAWVAGVVSERVGRVRTMLIASILLLVSAIGCGLCFSAVDLVIWRIVGGIGVGFASVIAPAYIAEISPAAHRGRLGSMQQMAIVLGIFVAFLVSALLVFVMGSADAVGLFGLAAWRWMYLSLAVPAVLYGLMALRLPESPRYLVERGRYVEAASVLTGDMGLEPGKPTEDKIEEIRATVHVERRQQFKDLLGRFGFHPLVWVGILLSVFQQFVGINVIFYYSTTLWKSVGFAESDSFTISLITSVINVLATIVAVLLIDVLGRKLLLMIGSGIMTLSLGAMSLAFAQAVTVDGAVSLPGSWGMVALVAANLFVIGFGATWGPAVWVLLGEIFPNSIRAMALGVAASAQWIANFVVSTTFPALAEAGLALAYGIYAFFALLSLVFVAFLIRETKGRTLEDMTL
ncbi:sugar porter family MFS transporter [Glutamicibacter soli]|uniref:MFS transporter n=1 Tax=Glutamicibacter soli TaxID=453836 RepID=A0A365YE60_9MICC|nr:MULTISPECIES: sugar porter family MFS transporter [Micrococcaceae]ALQ29154.1 MFS transporter [Arthrobacter sp. YC-RL1]KLI89444.1 major facilitator transporter [Arthrobacter sp. YC-RL1]RBM00981.1 MFS transporter [Glutamicibacter soli]RKS16576.1 sugar porter (SP) family MFS transporter [Arthrobacter sp. AG1021]